MNNDDMSVGHGVQSNITMQINVCFEKATQTNDNRL